MRKPITLMAIMTLLLILTLAGCGKPVISVVIEKSTNGQDADLAPGPEIPVGDTVTWTYTITSEGTATLEQISVTDDDLTVTPAYKSGDVNSDGMLQTTETWVYEATGIAELGQYSNTGTVEAWVGSTRFTDSDMSHYFSEGAPVQTTWEFDFMQTDVETIMDDEYWLVTGTTGEDPLGLWLNQCVVAPPIFFTGDFTAEYHFYPRVLPDEDIFNMAFRIWNNQSTTSTLRRFVAFTIYYLGNPADVSYYLSQGMGDLVSNQYYGDAPGIRINDINVCVFEKVGSQVTISLNGSLISTVTILPENAATGYAPMFYGHNSWEMADSNLFIRKVKVTYTSGETFTDEW